MSDMNSGFINDFNMILATDFYQLTMGAACYQYNLENNINDEEDVATFELFIRKLPKNRNYLIFAGLEQVLHYLQNAIKLKTKQKKKFNLFKVYFTNCFNSYQNLLNTLNILYENVKEMRERDEIDPSIDFNRVFKIERRFKTILNDFKKKEKSHKKYLDNLRHPKF